jgi:hypothetical protein
VGGSVRCGHARDEKRVEAAFADWLRQQGWTVETEVNFVDVYARRGDERLYAEAKGRTKEIGLDVDTMYGLLLRRMGSPAPATRHAVVVPVVAVRAALRVPGWARESLVVDVHEVDDAGGAHSRS